MVSNLRGILLMYTNTLNLLFFKIGEYQKHFV